MYLVPVSDTDAAAYRDDFLTDHLEGSASAEFEDGLKVFDPKEFGAMMVLDERGSYCRGEGPLSGPFDFFLAELFNLRAIRMTAFIR